MDSISPVFDNETIELERVLALDQPEFVPIIVLPLNFTDNTSGLCVRFKLSEQEKKLISEGADLVITQMTDNLFTPMHLAIVKTNERPF